MLSSSMSRAMAIFLTAIMLAHTAAAQEYLEPEPGVLAQMDNYDVKIGRVFAAAYAGDVVLRAFILPSFVPEEVVGIRHTDERYEAFVMAPTSTIWNTEIVRLYESGHITTSDNNGKPVPLAKNVEYQKLKRRTPDIRKITAKTKAVALPGPLAQRIAQVWQRMLLDARHPKAPRDGNDGATYHFSMWIQGYGIVSASIWSPDEGSRTGALTDLASALAQYAKGQLDSEQLAKALKPLE